MIFCEIDLNIRSFKKGYNFKKKKCKKNKCSNWKGGKCKCKGR